MVHMDTGAAVPAHTCTAGNGPHLGTNLAHSHVFIGRHTCNEAAVVVLLLVTSLGKRGRRRADLKAPTMVS